MSRLQHELKKKGPFESQAQEAMLNILRTNDLFQIQFVRLFRQFQLTPSQYNVLRILRGEGKPLPILEIADRLIAVVPGITGLIDRLEQAGWVTRKRCEQDRRVVYVALTEQASQVLSDLDPLVIDLHQKLVGHLSVAELRQLTSLLEKARQGVKPE